MIKFCYSRNNGENSKLVPNLSVSAARSSAMNVGALTTLAVLSYFKTQVSFEDKICLKNFTRTACEVNKCSVFCYLKFHFSYTFVINATCQYCVHERVLF